VYAVEKVEVILTVPSIEDTAAWYERVLGWAGHYDTFDAQGRCGFGSVMLGDMESVTRGERPFTGFNLSRFSGDPASYSNEGAHFTALICVDDVDALYARVVESDVTPGSAPEDQPWGGRAFWMQDLNGFALTFFQMIDQVPIEEVRRRYEETRKGEQAQMDGG
jgi:catechol 2,3-dioxygenase-like lactoylglutathione lyase family enzyme